MVTVVTVFDELDYQWFSSCTPFIVWLENCVVYSINTLSIKFHFNHTTFYKCVKAIGRKKLSAYHCDFFRYIYILCPDLVTANNKDKSNIFYIKYLHVNPVWLNSSIYYYIHESQWLA